MKPKSIFDLVKECESSARRALRTAGNLPGWEEGSTIPPDCEEICSAMSALAREAYRVLRLAKDFRRGIRSRDARAASLAAFRVGQAVMSVAMQPLAADASRGLKVRDGSRAGAEVSARKRAKPAQDIRDMIQKAVEMRVGGSDLTITGLARFLAPAFGMAPRTARRYIRKAFLQV
jgi:hypothetical protein